MSKSHPRLFTLISPQLLVRATGYQEGKEFVVLAGSTAASTLAPSGMSASYIRQRQAAIDTGAIIPLKKSPHLLSFARDTRFTSAAGAASILVGSQRNVDAWKDQDGLSPNKNRSSPAYTAGRRSFAKALHALAVQADDLTQAGDPEGVNFAWTLRMLATKAEEAAIPSGVNALLSVATTEWQTFSELCERLPAHNRGNLTTSLLKLTQTNRLQLRERKSSPKNPDFKDRAWRLPPDKTTQ